MQGAEKKDLDRENSKNESGRYNSLIVTHPSIHSNGNTEYFTRGLKNLDWSRGRGVVSRLVQPRTRRRSRFTAQVLFVHGEKSKQAGIPDESGPGNHSAAECVNRFSSRSWNFLQARGPGDMPKSRTGTSSVWCGPFSACRGGLYIQHTCSRRSG